MSVSAPPSPSSRLAPLLPVRTLAPSFPVAEIFAVPVRTRFSTLIVEGRLSEKLNAALTVSLPSWGSSTTRSPGMERHVCSVDLLDRQDVEHHRRDGVAAGSCAARHIVVAHHGIAL